VVPPKNRWEKKQELSGPEPVGSTGVSKNRSDGHETLLDDHVIILRLEWRSLGSAGNGLLCSMHLHRSVDKVVLAVRRRGHVLDTTASSLVGKVFTVNIYISCLQC
jgi:hypothetical protein